MLEPPRMAAQQEVGNTSVGVLSELSSRKNRDRPLVVISLVMQILCMHGHLHRP